MRFAHFTDLHLPIHGRPRLASLLNKRALGYQSWLRKRHKRHQQWTLDRLMDDSKTQDIDSFLITGDITNIALPAEFHDAAAWMDMHLATVPATMVPGNHDSYVRLPWQNGLGQLSHYMVGWPNFSAATSQPAQPRRDASDFPFIAQTGFADKICVICVNSCPPTAPGMASGLVGERQLKALTAILDDAASAGYYRLILIHHPVTDGVVSWRKALHDAAAFQNVIAVHGADLILHGHTHFPVHDTLAGPNGLVPVVGGGSASHTAGHGKYTPARYGILDITNAAEGWHTDIAIRELDIDTKDVGDRPAPVLEEAL